MPPGEASRSDQLLPSFVTSPGCHTETKKPPSVASGTKPSCISPWHRRQVGFGINGSDRCGDDKRYGVPMVIVNAVVPDLRTAEPELEGIRHQVHASAK